MAFSQGCGEILTSTLTGPVGVDDAGVYGQRLRGLVQGCLKIQVWVILKQELHRLKPVLPGVPAVLLP